MDDDSIGSLTKFSAAVLIALAAIALEAARSACLIQTPSMPSFTIDRGSPTPLPIDELAPTEGR